MTRILSLILLYFSANLYFHGCVSYTICYFWFFDFWEVAETLTSRKKHCDINNITSAEGWSSTSFILKLINVYKGKVEISGCITFMKGRMRAVLLYPLQITRTTRKTQNWDNSYNHKSLSTFFFFIRNKMNLRKLLFCNIWCDHRDDKTLLIIQWTSIR